jgi:hypothetical protein
MLAAAARALARLDLRSLKELDDLKELDWESVEAWCSFGQDLIDGDDEECEGLRKRICKLLLENHDACAEYFNKRLLDISPNGDIDQNSFDFALTTARSLGLMSPDETADANDRVKQWAVAMLCPTCQCCEEVMRAVLDLDLKKKVGILCLSRHKKARAYNYTIAAYQPLVLNGAAFVIAIYLKSKEKHVDTSDVRKTRSQKPRPDGTVAAADVGSEASLFEKQRGEVIFRDSYNSNHFEECIILNGHVGGALLSLSPVGSLSLRPGPEARLRRFGLGESDWCQ